MRPEASRRLAAAFDAPTASAGPALPYDEPDPPRTVTLGPVVRLVRAAREGARP
ncbi:hypothetical protein ACFY6U_10580 [Streptomyces sp. NPDC013157]|uniref:hypothetical protein n=1 Tax=Streptomyces sp. NPDC013157 TaxID=3364861 RepID=UPI0036BF2906